MTLRSASEHAIGYHLLLVVQFPHAEVAVVIASAVVGDARSEERREASMNAYRCASKRAGLERAEDVVVGHNSHAAGLEYSVRGVADLLYYDVRLVHVVLVDCRWVDLARKHSRSDLTQAGSSAYDQGLNWGDVWYFLNLVSNPFARLTYMEHHCRWVVKPMGRASCARSLRYFVGVEVRRARVDLLVVV